MKLGLGLEGCQSGLGIFAQSGGGVTSKVGVSDTSVHDYQKNGITGNEVGTDIFVDDNVVTGIGPTTGAAQNGVQVGFGATGAIRQNSIMNHIWSSCVSPSMCTDIATNILIFGANDVVVTQNTLGKSQTSVSIVGGNNCRVQGNTIFQTDVFDGVALQGDNNMVTTNHITNSDEAAVFVNGDNNRIQGNKINETPVGVLKAAGSTGNMISGNSFVNTPTPVVDPPPPLGIGPRPFR
jgi:nitrous oxidase accessory protein NosD